jgi:hypothetical protein
MMYWQSHLPVNGAEEFEAAMPFDTETRLPFVGK